ncbi:MAG: hypothetical protein H0U76_29505, partial [Ktedonobacteraceae bacterium]|nr:hypothetical protein [Ktedonobacteraceae bacterium]
MHRQVAASRRGGERGGGYPDPERGAGQVDVRGDEQVVTLHTYMDILRRQIAINRHAANAATQCRQRRGRDLDVGVHRRTGRLHLARWPLHIGHASLGLRETHRVLQV